MNGPTSPLVACAWLRTIPGLTAGVATRRPSTVTSWSEHGFVVVSVVGDQSSTDVPQRMPILSVDAWTVAPGSSQPPRNQANAITETIRAATFDPALVSVLVTPATGYARALVQSAWALTEPREVAEPDASMAHFTMDLGLAWVRAE